MDEIKELEIVTYYGDHLVSKITGAYGPKIVFEKVAAKDKYGKFIKFLSMQETINLLPLPHIKTSFKKRSATILKKIAAQAST